MNLLDLISAVYMRRPLWDQKDKNHHNRFVLDKLWDEIAAGLNAKRIIVRTKWKSLRDKYRTILTSLPKGKSGEPQLDKYEGQWKYFSSLIFLKSQFTSKTSKENLLMITKEEIVDESYQNIYQVNDADQSTSLIDETIRFTPEENTDSMTSSWPNPTESYIIIDTRKRKTPASEEHTLTEMEKKKVQFEEHDSQNSDEDDDLNFFKSLLPHVKMFSAYNKMEYRMKVMKITQEFLKPSQ